MGNLNEDRLYFKGLLAETLHPASILICFNLQYYQGHIVCVVVS